MLLKFLSQCCSFDNFKVYFKNPVNYQCGIEESLYLQILELIIQISLTDCSQIFLFHSSLLLFTACCPILITPLCFINICCSAWSRSQVQNHSFGPKQNTKLTADQHPPPITSRLCVPWACRRNGTILPMVTCWDRVTCSPRVTYCPEKTYH